MAAFFMNLPDDISTRLQNLATATGQSKVFFAKQAILEKLDELEDYDEAIETVERVRGGKEAIFTLDEVETELGLKGRIGKNWGEELGTDNGNLQ